MAEKRFYRSVLEILADSCWININSKLTEFLMKSEIENTARLLSEDNNDVVQIENESNAKRKRRRGYDSVISPRPGLAQDWCQEMTNMFLDFPFLPMYEVKSKEVMKNTFMKGISDDFNDIIFNSQDFDINNSIAADRAKIYNEQDYYNWKTQMSDIFYQCFSFDESSINLIPKHAIGLFSNELNSSAYYEDKEFVKFSGKGNNNNMNQMYYASGSPDEIVYKTLPGYLIQLIYHNGPLTEEQWHTMIEPVYHYLRRLNGQPYTNNILKAIRGALHANGLFVKDNHGFWHVKEPDWSTYVISEIQKIVRFKVKMGNKKRYQQNLHMLNIDEQPFKSPISTLPPLPNEYNYEAFHPDRQHFDDMGANYSNKFDDNKKKYKNPEVLEIIRRKKLYELWEKLDPEINEKYEFYHSSIDKDLKKISDFIESVPSDLSDLKIAYLNNKMNFQFVMQVYWAFRYSCRFISNNLSRFKLAIEFKRITDTVLWENSKKFYWNIRVNQSNIQIRRFTDSSSRHPTDNFKCWWQRHQLSPPRYKIWGQVISIFTNLTCQMINNLKL